MQNQQALWPQIQAAVEKSTVLISWLQGTSAMHLAATVDRFSLTSQLGFHLICTTAQSVVKERIVLLILC